LLGEEKAIADFSQSLGKNSQKWISKSKNKGVRKAVVQTSTPSSQM
jgi:peptidyl-tRNA hydrolase